MTWNPSNGFWSENDLEVFSGSLTSSLSVTGGVMALLPEVTITRGFLATWVDFTGWSFSNNLASLHLVTGDFIVESGAVYLGDTNNQSGKAYSTNFGRAFRVENNALTFSSGAYSGEGYAYFGLESGSPDSGFYSFCTGGGNTFTLEFEVASYNQYINSTLSGFTSGSTNTLSPRSGIFNHGVYIDNGTYWDYFEVSPNGIQSVNHPELAIPVDLTGPHRFRIAFQNQDIYLLSQDGYSVQGLGKLDNDTVSSSNTAKIAFGAPPLSGQDFDLYTLNCDFVAGKTDWSNIKLVTGELLLSLPTGQKQSYTTVTQTGYTSAFDPRITLQSFSFAEVYFNPSKSGVTTVTAQYSGTSWTDSSSITLSGNSPNVIDLSDIPIFNIPRTSYGSDYLSNPIRFKVEMTSNGISPPPSIEGFKVFSNHEKSLLDLVPSWKPSNIPVQVTATVLSDLVKPEVEQWTTFLYLASSTTGSVSGSFSTDLASSLPIQGQGEIIANGRFGTSFKNTLNLEATAAIGSDADLYYGQLPTKNCYPNIFFDLPFTNLSTGVVFAEGNIATLARVPVNNTGQYFTRYEAVSVSRPEREAKTSQLASYYNLINPTSDKAQKVTVFTSASTSDGQAGIEFIVPSGIVTSKVQLLADLKIESGTGIYLGATGDTDSVYHFIPRTTEEYITVSYESNTSYSGEIAFQFLVPSGEVLTEDIIFTVDNVQCKPISESYIYSSGVPTYLHKTGSVTRGTPLISQTEPFKSSTVMYGDFFIEALPRSGQAILFERTRVSDGEGVSVRVDSQGVLTASYDMYSKAHVSGYTSSDFFPEELVGNFVITGASTVPVGRWVNIGFIHQQETSDYLGMAESQYNFYPYNLSVSNRCFLTIDGNPVASKDNMSNWQKWDTVLTDPAPYVSYIADGTGIYVAASGLKCLTNGLYISNPVSSSAEPSLSIRGAQNTGPYFVPDIFFKPNNTNSNVLVNPLATPNGLGDDLNIHSIFNFYSPGLTNWDHGPIGNHLVFYGSVEVESSGNPYNIGGYTRFKTGYGVAPYSSSFDRLFNYTGHLGLASATALATSNNEGTLEVTSWIKPFSTGEIFSMVEDINNPTSGSFRILIDSNYNLVSQRVSSNGSIAWSLTGFSSPSGEWTWFRSINQLGYYTGLGTTGSYFSAFYPESGNPTGLPLSTGENAGFQYYGRSGSLTESAFYFGYEADVGFCDATINSYNPTFGPLNTYNGLAIATGNKGGRFNTFMEGSTIMAQTGVFNSFTSAIINLPPSSIGQKRNIWISCLNGYDSNPRYSIGIPVFDDEPFIESAGYYIKYDLSGLYSKVGRTDSPIVMGRQVPDTNINLAFVTNNDYSLDSAISVLDLSSYTKSNLSIYNLGEYSTTSTTSIENSTTGSYNGINSEYFTGKVNVTYSGSLFSKEVDISNISISNEALSEPAPAMYYYLIGRGKWAVIADGAAPHPTGLDYSSTGQAVDTYVQNKEIIFSQIEIKDSQGVLIDFIEYPYDIITTNTSYSDYLTALRSGESISVDGLEALSRSGSLPSEVYSVVLLLNKKRLQREDSVWVHYKGYNLDNGKIETRREIVNPYRIYTEKSESSDPFIANYSVDMNPTSYQEYDLTVYGIKDIYSGYY